MHTAAKVGIALIVTLTAHGCGDGDDHTDAQQQREARPAAALEIDWESVPLADSREVGFPVLMRLLRMIDHWHGGEVPAVAVEISADGIVTDHLGNSLSVTLTAWKTMLDGLQRNPSQPVEVFALSPHAFDYDDNLGEVKQFVYAIHIESMTRLVLHVRRPYERGS